MAELRKRISIPINAGQSEMTSWAVRRLLDAEAVDIVNFDMSHGGGPTEWLRAATMCGSVMLKCSITKKLTWQYMHWPLCRMGLYGCFPDPNRDPIWDKMILNRPNVADGYIDVPQGPGFDIKLDWDAVKKFTIS